MANKKDTKARCSFTASAEVANAVRRICKERGITVSSFIEGLVLADAGFASFCSGGVRRHKKNGGK